MNRFLPLILVLSFLSQTAAIDISSLSDLQKIGTDPSFPLTGTYTLTADIDASSTKQQNEGKGFLPIAGGWNQEFAGVFDGAGYSINDLYINSPDSTNDGLFVNREPVGLFGYIGESGIVKNLKMKNARIHGYQRIGIISGFNKGTIQDCEVSGKVTCDRQLAGGITGVLGGVNLKLTGKVYRCIATVDVSGGINSCGGIAGWCYKGTVEECATFGFISSTKRVGGIFGGCNGGIIIRSFSTAALTSDSLAGGLVGWANSESPQIKSEITECWSAGKINCENKAGGSFGWLNNNSSITKSYWDFELSGKTQSTTFNVTTGLPTNDMLKSTSFVEWDFATIWKINEDKSFPHLKWMEFPKYTVNYTAGPGGTLSGDTIQELDMLSIGSPVTANPSVDYSFISWSDNLHSPTRQDIGIVSDTTLTAIFSQPVPISTFDELLKIGTDPDYRLDYHYYLTNDLNGNNTSFSTLGGSEPFWGSFDGKGFSITSFSLNGPLFSSLKEDALIKDLKINKANVTASEGYSGVITGLNRGSLSKVTITQSTINSNDHITGGLVGVNISGTVSDCQAEVDITTDSLVAGGLIGYLFDGTVERCGASGSVSASIQAGGLVGFMKNGTIKESYATGNVFSKDWASGGAIGVFQNGFIENCYAQGDVTGGDTAKDIGGFVGRQMGGSGTNCYSTGKVIGSVTDRTGGFIGLSDGGTFNESYWDTTSSEISVSQLGTGIGTSDFKSEANFSSWNFKDIWLSDPSSSYPIFKWQKTGPVSNSDYVFNHLFKQIEMSLLNNQNISLKLPNNLKGNFKVYRADGRVLMKMKVNGSTIIKLDKLSNQLLLCRFNSTNGKSLVKKFILR